MDLLSPLAINNNCMYVGVSYRQVKQVVTYVTLYVLSCHNQNTIAFGADLLLLYSYHLATTDYLQGHLRSI